MVVLLAGTTYIFTDILTKIGVNPGIIPIVSVVVLLLPIYFINRKMEGWAFIQRVLAHRTDPGRFLHADVPTCDGLQHQS